MGVILGFDPGGKGKFGWCVAAGSRLPLRLLQTGTADHALAAFDRAMCAAAGNDVDAIGIDAPLFWRADGDREVDRLVRTRIVELGSAGGTVNSVNSMRGACLAQGIAVGMLARAKLGSCVPLTESHPKAMLWMIGVASKQRPPNDVSGIQLKQYFTGQLSADPDHERDAALGALSAFAMLNNHDGWHDLFPLENSPLLPLAPPIGYWMPVIDRSFDFTNSLLY